MKKKQDQQFEQTQVEGLVQGCSISIANRPKIVQSCKKKPARYKGYTS